MQPVANHVRHNIYYMSTERSHTDLEMIRVSSRQSQKPFKHSWCTVAVILCFFVPLQVLLFLQKEKEESSPEAQVNEENRENLKHCGHCQVLNGSNYTDPPIPFLLPVTPSPLYPLSLCTSLPRALSFSFSVLPGYWRVKGMLRSGWGHNRLLIPLSTKNKHTCITTGGLRKSKKAITMKTLAWIWKKKDTVWNSCCI